MSVFDPVKSSMKGGYANLIGFLGESSLPANRKNGLIKIAESIDARHNELGVAIQTHANYFDEIKDPKARLSKITALTGKLNALQIEWSKFETECNKIKNMLNPSLFKGDAFANASNELGELQKLSNMASDLVKSLLENSINGNFQNSEQMIRGMKNYADMVFSLTDRCIKRKSI